jgi:phosphatidylserine/phosphatidylglycerophosphate/cardiolipin synthase-like enzyme
MRSKNEDNALKAYAVAGTQTVLLAMDIDKKKVAGKSFMGFKITRYEGSRPPVHLNGTKRFRLDTGADRKQKLSPIQSFFWKDYTADPGKKYKYKIEAMFGPWDDLTPQFETEVKVETEALEDAGHSVYFNFGVTGCQAYAKVFEEKRIEDLDPLERERAFRILGRELYEDGLLKFVARAKDGDYGLLCAFYELEYAPFVDELKKAKDRGADVRIVYNAKKEAGKRSEAEIARAGLDSVRIERDFQVAQPHNKFMILVHKGVPIEVWTGSTNITIRGIFGHCNTGHWVKDAEIAGKYNSYWKMLATNPAKKDFTAETERIQGDFSGNNLRKGVKVIFSPRKSAAMLSEYVKIMDDAKTAVCIIFPFNIEKIFKDFYAVDKKYIRFIITDKCGKKTDFVTNDRDVYRTAGAILETQVEQWVKEMTAKTTTGAGTLYVHNKFFIVDPLGESPVVVTGSANFSDESLTGNDENMLIIKGDRRVADIYFSEFARLFDHFLPRYLRKIAGGGGGFEKPLDDEGKWIEDYYNEEKIKQKRKMMFIDMYTD